MVKGHRLTRVIVLSLELNPIVTPAYLFAREVCSVCVVGVQEFIDSTVIDPTHGIHSTIHIIHQGGVPQSFSGQLISMFRSTPDGRRTQEGTRPLDLKAEA